MTDPTVSARAAATLTQLVNANRRFASGEPAGHRFTEADRERLLKAQDPHAVVLGCVDARVPPELIFDQPVGSLLTVRTAGQALAGVALGSIEFGVRVLGVPLVIVLGHTGCGAVLAAIGHVDDPAGGHLGDLTGEVAGRLTAVIGTDPLHATGANLEATVDALRRLGTLETPTSGPAIVVGVLYDMSTGLVHITDDAGLGLA